MFAQTPSDSLLTHIEDYLAHIAGKASWPTAQACVETNLIVPTADFEHSCASTYLVVSYEVDGNAYSAAIKTLTGEQEFLRDLGGFVTIQYDPERPSEYYYAPACKLAGRLVVAALLLLALCAIVFLIGVHKQAIV